VSELFLRLFAHSSRFQAAFLSGVTVLKVSISLHFRDVSLVILLRTYFALRVAFAHAARCSIFRAWCYVFSIEIPLKLCGQLRKLDLVLHRLLPIFVDPLKGSEPGKN